MAITITEGDVAAGVEGQWATSGMNTTAGPLLFNRVPINLGDHPIATPYATLKVTGGEYLWTSGTVYIQIFEVEIAVWSNQGVPTGGAIKEAMLGAFDRQSLIGKLPVGGGNCRDFEPVSGGKFELDERQKLAKDVLICGQKWKCNVQGNR